MTVLPSTFEAVAEIIASTADVEVGAITRDSHVMRDLGVDSLAFLDITFAIDQKFGIRLPVEDWIQQVNEGDVESDHYFKVGNLCRHVEDLVAAESTSAIAV